MSLVSTKLLLIDVSIDGDLRLQFVVRQATPSDHNALEKELEKDTLIDDSPN